MKKQELDRMLRGLPREIPPQRDLWPGIVSAIDRARGPRLDTDRAEKRGVAPPPRVRLIPRLAAALLSAAILVSAVFALVRLLPANAAVAEDQTTKELSAEMEVAAKRYRRAKTELLRILRRIEDAYGAEVASSIVGQFEAIDEVIESVEAAVQSAPGDSDSAGRLFALYSIQLRAIAYTEGLIETAHE